MQYMALNILEYEELSMPNDTIPCNVIDFENGGSEKLKTISESIGSQEAFIKSRRLNVTISKLNDKKEMSLIVDKKKGDITLSEFDNTLKEVLWICEDLDIYSLAFINIEELGLDRDEIISSIQKIFDGKCIEVYI